MLSLILACALDPAPPAGSELCETHIWFIDADGDGMGEGEIEACDGVDQDCDEAIDEDFAFFAAAPDADGDAFGDPTRADQVCALPGGWVLDSTDCADDDPAVNPSAPEICNGFDDDCDGLVDLDDSPVSGSITMYVDADGDGYGDASTSDIRCAIASGYVTDATDCDDTEANIHPDAVEVCLDSIDQDCDGYVDDYDCAGSETTATLDLCDPAVVPVDATLCAAGVAAVLPTGTTFATVQSAIDAATAGDVVTVCAGTWTENLVQTVSPLSLVGYGYGLSVLAGAGTTVLDVGTGSTLTLVDLAIENGIAFEGGGLLARDATICIARTEFTANEALYSASTSRDGGAPP